MIQKSLIPYDPALRILSTRRPNVAIDVDAGYMFDLDNNRLCFKVPEGDYSKVYKEEAINSLRRSGFTDIQCMEFPKGSNIHFCTFRRKQNA